MTVTVRVINTDCVKGYIQIQCGYSGMILTIEDARQLVSDLNDAIME